MKLKTGIVMILLGVTGISQAATKETTPGLVCNSVYNVTENYGRDIDFQYGSIFNRSTTRWGYINCPITRNGYTTGAITDVEVSVNDTDGNMWCSVYSRDRYGNVVGSKTASSGGTGNRIIDLGSVPGSVPYEGYADLFCVLPRNGGAIRSIAVDVGS